jgi:riboflavin kinase/FMN adenylyltransferase
MGLENDFFVEGVPEVRMDGLRVSSTLIRQKVQTGNMEEARRLLGDPFTLWGNVVEGERLGGRLGIPTANLAVENELLPAKGVYITRALLAAGAHESVTNVGIRPTVGGRKLTVETHLLDYSGNLYGLELELQFLAKIRDEMRFSGVEELKTAILSDIRAAYTYFKTVKL